MHIFISKQCTSHQNKSLFPSDQLNLFWSSSAILLSKLQHRTTEPYDNMAILSLNAEIHIMSSSQSSTIVISGLNRAVSNLLLASVLQLQ